MITFNSLCRSQVVKREVSAITCLSMPWNPFVSCRDIHSGINYYLFNMPISASLKQLATKHVKVLAGLGINQKLLDQLHTIKGYFLNSYAWECIELFFIDFLLSLVNCQCLKSSASHELCINGVTVFFVTIKSTIMKFFVKSSESVYAPVGIACGG